MTIKWEESVPSNASLVGFAPTDFRSVWTSVAEGMAVEHFWPGSGGASFASAGDLLPGASRMFTGSRSASSAPNSQMTGRLFLDNTNGRVYAYESAGTYLVGSMWNEESRNPTLGSNVFFMRQSGALTGVPTGSGATIVAFPVPFANVPTVWLTSSSNSWFFTLFSSTITDFTSMRSSFAGAASTATMYWEAFGTVSLSSL